MVGRLITPHFAVGEGPAGWVHVSGGLQVEIESDPPIIPTSDPLATDDFRAELTLNG